MKILFSLLAFCLFASCVHSQEAVDTVSVRVQYRALYKHTQEQKEAYDDINLLDIGRHSSRFYSQRFEQGFKGTGTLVRGCRERPASPAV